MVTLDQFRVKPGHCLVKLAPVMSQSGLIITAPDVRMRDEGETAVAMEWQSELPIHGKVVKVGDAVHDVATGDVVMFSCEAGKPVDDVFPTPYLLIRESEIDAIVERNA